MTVAPKAVWLEANIAGTSSTPTPATVASFCTGSSRNVKRVYIDVTALLASGLPAFYDHIWLAQLKAALSAVGVELWAAVAGSTVDHTSGNYKCASAAIRARALADLTVTSQSYNSALTATNDNWPYHGVAKTTPLFAGFSADLEPWANVPWPGVNNDAPTNAQQDDLKTIVSDTAGELRTTTSSYQLWFNGVYATTAPVMKFLLHTSFWLNNIGWHGALPATDNMALHVLPWLDEVDIMTHSTGNVQRDYSKPMLTIAEATSAITKSWISYLSSSFATNAALLTDADSVYTQLKAVPYNKLNGTDVYNYTGWASI